MEIHVSQIYLVNIEYNLYVILHSNRPVVNSVIFVW